MALSCWTARWRSSWWPTEASVCTVASIPPSTYRGRRTEVSFWLPFHSVSGALVPVWYSIWKMTRRSSSLKCLGFRGHCLWKSCSSPWMSSPFPGAAWCIATMRQKEGEWCLGVTWVSPWRSKSAGTIREIVLTSSHWIPWNHALLGTSDISLMNPQPPNGDWASSDHL